MDIKEYSISICLVTRNRSKYLHTAIQSIRDQLIQPLEIIVSDDSDDFYEINSNKEICRQKNCVYYTGPKKGLYANRNFVANLAKGTHLRTMDDDHTLPEDHIETCINAIIKEPSTIWTIGEFYPNDKPYKYDTPVAPGQLHPRGFSFTPIKMENYYGISCGATIYPKVVIKNYKNDEKFKFGPTYLEYGARLKKNGYTIKHLINTHIIHHSFETFANINTNDELNEARIYSMLLLSFKYQPLLKNKILTILQIGFELMTLKLTIKNIKNSYTKAFFIP